MCREHVDAGAQQILGVFELRGVHATRRLRACASSMIARYSAGASFLTAPPRSSTQVLTNLTLRSASSWTAARAPSTVVTA